MRSFLVGIAITTVLFASADGAFAQRAFTNKEFNDRIAAMRSRLQNQQIKSVRKVVDHTPENTETVAVKTEKKKVAKVQKPFLELDNQPDASLTVLFHDTEFSSPRQNEKSPARIADTKFNSNEESRLRQEKFDALRMKVRNATRRTHSTAMEINNQVAKLP